MTDAKSISYFQYIFHQKNTHVPEGRIRFHLTQADHIENCVWLDTSYHQAYLIAMWFSKVLWQRGPEPLEITLDNGFLTLSITQSTLTISGADSHKSLTVSFNADSAQWMMFAVCCTLGEVFREESKIKIFDVEGHPLISDRTNTSFQENHTDKTLQSSTVPESISPPEKGITYEAEFAPVSIAEDLRRFVSTQARVGGKFDIKHGFIGTLGKGEWTKVTPNELSAHVSGRLLGDDFQFLFSITLEELDEIHMVFGPYIGKGGYRIDRNHQGDWLNFVKFDWIVGPPISIRPHVVVRWKEIETHIRFHFGVEHHLYLVPTS